MDSMDNTLIVPPYTQIFWGLVIASVLYGMTLIQAFIYYSNTKDRAFFRGLVALLVALDTADTITSGIAVQYFLIDNWGNKAILPVLPPSITAELFISSWIVLIVQLFFARQILRFNRNSWPWCLLMVICSVVGTGLTFAFSVHSFEIQQADVANQTPWKFFVTVPSILSLVVDLLAALLLSLFLNASQSEYRIKRTENIIKRILIFTVTRAVLVSAIQLIFLVLYLVIPVSQDWAPFRLMVAKVYVNTFLAMLNSREILAKKNPNAVNSSGSAGGLGTNRFNNTNKHISVRLNNPTHIQVETSVVRSNDIEMGTIPFHHIQGKLNDDPESTALSVYPPKH